MTHPDPEQARVRRRRRTHERQAVVFGLLIAFLAVCGIGALAVYTGALDAPFSRPFTTPQAEDEPGLDAPCLPAVEGQPDGALPVPYADVQVRVLNASGTQGVAGANAEILADRGFQVIGTGDADTTHQHTQLRFGTPGITAAYTLAAHYPDTVLVLDARQDATVDLLVGTQFDDLVPADEVALQAEQPLTNVEGCKPADQITPQPAPTAEQPAAEG